MSILLLLIAIVATLAILFMSWIIYHAGKEIGWQKGFREGEKIGLANGQELGYLEAKDTVGDWYEPRPFGS